MRIAAVVVLSLWVGLAIAKKPPNVIFIAADDLGWNDVSWRNPDIISPHLADLAHTGVKLDQYYVYKVCSPTRASFMTGRIPYNAGLHGFIGFGKPDAISLNYTFLPQDLKRAGYATHMVGKWHLGYWDIPYVPTQRGFDTYFGYFNGAEDYWQHTTHSCPNAPPPVDLSSWVDTKQTPELGHNGTYSTDMFVKRINNLIASHPSHQPLYMYLPFQSVHEPIQAPESVINQYPPNAPRRVFGGMVTALDIAVNEVVEALKTTGLYNDTVIIFSTDNGGNTRAQGNNLPLRGAKFTFWEGGTRGVSFVHSPLLPSSVRGSTSNVLMHAADWYQTILAIAGATGGKTAIDSHNMWPAITGVNTTQPRTEIVQEISKKGTGKLRSGRYNLYVGYPGTPDTWVPVSNKTDDNSGADQPCDKKACLFDVITDPNEHHDIAGENEALVKQLTDRLKRAWCPECAMDVGKGKATVCEEMSKWGGVLGPWLTTKA